MDGYRDFYKLNEEQQVKDPDRYKRLVAQGSLRIMKNAHVFHVMEKKIGKLLSETDNSPHEGMKLPFPVVWIECPFDFEGASYPGILVYEARPHSDTLDPVTGRPSLKVDPNGNIVDGDCAPHIFYETFRFSLKDQTPQNYMQDRYYVYFLRNTLWGEQAELEKPKTRADKREREFIERMVVNFIDFLNTPDVQVVTIEKSDKARARKEKKHGIPEPAKLSRILIKGELKRYVDSIGEIRGPIGHAFEVRGHFSHLRAERWTIDPENKCQCGCRRLAWVPPHTRGKGVLVRKEYALEAEGEE